MRRVCLCVCEASRGICEHFARVTLGIIFRLYSGGTVKMLYAIVIIANAKIESFNNFEPNKKLNEQKKNGKKSETTKKRKKESLPSGLHNYGFYEEEKKHFANVTFFPFAFRSLVRVSCAPIPSACSIAFYTAKRCYERRL